MRVEKLVSFWPHALFSAGLVAVVGLFWVFLGKESYAFLGPLVVGSLPSIVALVFVFVGIALVADYTLDSPAFGTVLAVSAFVSALILAAFGVTNLHLRYSDNMEMASSLPVFVENGNRIQAQSALQQAADAHNLQTTNVTYLGGGLWSAFGESVGDDSVLSHVLVWDSAGGLDAVTSCEFSNPRHTVSGWPTNLVNQVRDLRSGGFVDANSSDAYGACLNGDATVLLPWVHYSGVFPPTAVYGGLSQVLSDGSHVFHESVTPGEFPGPVYSASLARRVATANGARLDSRMTLMWDESATMGVDSGGIAEKNVRHPGEQLISDTSGRLWFVNPLLAHESEVTKAVAYTPADEASLGDVNKLSIFEFESLWPSRKAAENNIRKAFPDLPWHKSDFVVQNVVYNPNLWTGSLGLGTQDLFRFTVAPSGEVCVAVSTKATFDCSGAPVESGVADRSTQELLLLRDEVLAELDKRDIIEAGTR